MDITNFGKSVQTHSADLSNQAELDFNSLSSDRRGVLFVYGTTESQMSAMTRETVELTKHHLPETLVVDISRNMHLRRIVRQKSGWDFFPQLHLLGEFIGGTVVLEEFFRSAEHVRIFGRDRVLDDDRLIDKSMLRRTVEPATKLWRFSGSHTEPIVAAASACGNLYTWDFSISERPNKTKISEGWINSVAVSSSNREVFAGLTDGSIRTAPSSISPKSRMWQAHSRWVNDLAISKTGERLWSVSADRSVAAWNGADFTLLARITGHTECVWCVCVSDSESVVATGDAAGFVKFWEADSLLPILDCHAHSACVTAICNVDGVMCSSSFDGTVAIFDEKFRIVGRFTEHTERVWTVAGIPNSKHCVSASGDGTVRVWSTVSAMEVSRHQSREMPIAVLYVAELGGVMVSHDDGSVSLLELDRHHRIVKCRPLLLQ